MLTMFMNPETGTAAEFLTYDKEKPHSRLAVSGLFKNLHLCL